jgi:adhesin/invasin
VAGQQIAPAVTVQLEDGSSNPVASSGVSVTMTLSSGAGALAGTTSRTTNGSGVATFGDLSINLVGSKRLTASSGALTPAVSNSFAIMTGAAATIAATGGTPQYTAPGSCFPQLLKVTVTDGCGNPVPGVVVTFFAPGSGPGGCFPGDSLTAVATTGIDGVATSPPFTANGLEGDYTVIATAAGPSGSALFALGNGADEDKDIPALGTAGLALLALLLGGAGGARLLRARRSGRCGR